MSSLNAILTKASPVLPTKKALIILDLQNDFCSPDGLVPVTLLDGFDNFQDLVGSFRETGEVIWSLTCIPLNWHNYHKAPIDAVIVHNDSCESPEKASTEPEDSEDEMLRDALNTNKLCKPSAHRMIELMKRMNIRDANAPTRSQPVRSRDLFLSHEDGAKVCCESGSYGAKVAPFAAAVKSYEKDHHAHKRSYSAFSDPALLAHLRSRIVTELYLCGSLSNISVYATASDAVRHGFSVRIINDCLGYRNLSAHQEALKQMQEVMGATSLTASECVAQLRAKKEVTPTSPLPETSAKHPLTNDPHVLVPTCDTDRALNHGLSKHDSEKASINPEIAKINAHEVQHTACDSAPVANIDHPNSVSTNAESQSNMGHLNSTSTDAELQSNFDQPNSTGAGTELEPNFSPDKIAAMADDLLARQRTDATQRKQEAQSGSSKQTRRPQAPAHPVCRPGDSIGEGDSRIIYDTLLDGKIKDMFYSVKNEVLWQKMYHATGEVPRLVCVQGLTDPKTGTQPVYRHPADQLLPLLHFSSTVHSIRREVEKVVSHRMNHVLIQLYRSGEDNISEHSDKTLDIVRGSSIVNVSLGAQRRMRLRTKRPKHDKSSLSIGNTMETDVLVDAPARRTQLLPMPHASIFVLGPKTNEVWLHGINADRRPSSERSAEELAYDGERISLTFRNIGTFLDSESRLVWGQGACAKSEVEARPVINGDAEAAQKLINAFGVENQQSQFDWDATYGAGFDVHDFKTDPGPEQPLLFLSGNTTEDQRVQICLNELGIRYQVVGASRADVGREYRPRVCYRDTDKLRTQIYGSFIILQYLDRVYGSPEQPRAVTAEAQRLISEQNIAQDWKTTLDELDELLENRQFLAGEEFSLADCVYWPAVEEIWKRAEYQDVNKWPKVRMWHKELGKRKGIQDAARKDTRG